MTYDYFRDAYSVTSSRAHRAGEQVHVSYGPQSNDSLLQFYGFVEAGNAADTYVHTRLLTWLAQLQPAAPARLDALRAAGLLGAVEEATLTRAGVGAPALQALRFLLAPEPDVAAKGPGGFAHPGDEPTERKLALALVHVVQAELAALGGSAEQDRQQLAAAARGPGATALAFRIEKKAVLGACLDALRGGGSSVVER